MLTQSPGSISVSLRMIPGIPLDLQGRRRDIPKTQDTHTGNLSLRLEKRLLILPFSDSFIITGEAKKFILLCSAIRYR